MVMVLSGKNHVNAAAEVDEGCVCFTIYDPVCVDGQLFSNACVAVCEGFPEEMHTPTLEDGTCPAQSPEAEEPAPEEEPLPEDGSCILSGGEIVLNGFAGNDTGSNYCNLCNCNDSFLICTLMFCDPLDKEVIVPDGCKLTGGEMVTDGFSGYDTGPNSCNRCFCSDGMLGCTKKYCLP